MSASSTSCNRKHSFGVSFLIRIATGRMSSQNSINFFLSIGCANWLTTNSHISLNLPSGFHERKRRLIWFILSMEISLVGLPLFFALYCSGKMILNNFKHSSCVFSIPKSFRYALYTTRTSVWKSRLILLIYLYYYDKSSYCLYCRCNLVAVRFKRHCIGEASPPPLILAEYVLLRFIPFVCLSLISFINFSHSIVFCCEGCDTPDYPPQ